MTEPCRLAALVVTATVLAAPAHADPDTDFANQLHTYGIYGPRDFNAWLLSFTTVPTRSLLCTMLRSLR